MINLQTAITLVGFCVTIASFFISRAKDIEEKTEANVKVNYKLDQQCGDIADIKDGIRESNTLLNEVVKTQTGHDKDIKNIMREIEKMDKRIANLEKVSLDDGRQRGHGIMVGTMDQELTPEELAELEERNINNPIDGERGDD